MPAQIARLEKYCRNKGLEVLKAFSFDESVYTTERDESVLENGLKKLDIKGPVRITAIFFLAKARPD